MKIKPLFLLMMIVTMPLVSCQKEDTNEETTQNEVVNNDDNGGGNNGGNENGGNNNESDNYYFRCFITQILRDWRAGNTTVYFETNSEWSVTLDDSHFEAPVSVSPESGNGNGSIVISYGEHSNHYDCSDYLYIKFRYVDKIYPNGNKHYDVKTYTLSRIYHKINP